MDDKNVAIDRHISNVSHISTLAGFHNRIVHVHLTSNSVANGRLIKYDSLGITLEMYRLRGEWPTKFYPWTSVNNLELSTWKDLK